MLNLTLAHLVSPCLRSRPVFSLWCSILETTYSCLKAPSSPSMSMHRLWWWKPHPECLPPQFYQPVLSVMIYPPLTCRNMYFCCCYMEHDWVLDKLDCNNSPRGCINSHNCRVSFQAWKLWEIHTQLWPSMCGYLGDGHWLACQELTTFVHGVLSSGVWLSVCTAHSDMHCVHMLHTLHPFP